MSLYKDASLVMIPSAYKDGKLYSIRPTDGSGDFTFSRGSNLAATRVDVNGLIEKGRENQILYSQDFSNAAWSKGSHTIVSNAAVAPDGTTTADKLVADNGLDPSVANSSGVFQNRTIPTSLYSISVYAKAAEFTSIRFRENYVVGSLLTIDLTDGSITGGGSQYSDVKAVSVGNGWYRISFFYNQTTGNPAKYTLRCADTGDGTSGVYIWGYQQEQGLVATDYIETGTSAAQSGILEDMPRLDYSGSCPALLLEPQRSNLMTNSEYTGAYLKSSITTTSNQATSPEGIDNATEVETTSTGQCHLRAAFTAATGNYVGSVFVKKQDFDYIYMEMGGAYAWFNIDTGALGNGNAYGSDWTYVDHSIEDYGNGWYRCVLVGNCVTAGAYTFRSVQPVPSNGAYNSGLSGGVTYWYGAQIESGSYPTSYIPTYGTSQTRSEDSATDTDISSYYVQNGSTLFFEIECDGEVDESNVTALLRLGTSVNTTRVSFLQGYNRIYTTWYDGNTGALGTINTLDAGDRVKVAVQIANDGIGRMNGGVNGIGNTIRDYTLSSENYTRLEIYRSSRFKQLMIFPTLLTASEMEALTTL